MRIFCALTLALGLLSLDAPAQLKELRPGWNVFSTQQDIQLGREASTEISRQVRVLHNREVDAYLQTILGKLEKSSYARTLNRDGSRGEMFPFSIHAVQDKNINAFSLPGGPIFVNTGVIDAADNEAQLAGVIGHEMSHIVLRHSTSQASKQNLVALPALLASAIVGNKSLLAELTQFGIAFTANSAMLKFTRSDEAQADYNGALIAADAGYNPLELANFFEKLEAKAGRQGALAQFLSDHPNPGNRVEAIQEEIRQIPRRQYVEDETGQFNRIKDLVHRLPSAPRAAADTPVEEPPPPMSSVRPSGDLRVYRGNSFSFSYPANWEVLGDEPGNGVTIAPRQGMVQGSNGRAAVGYGIEAGFYRPAAGRADLDRDTPALIRQLRDSNAGLRVGRDGRSIEVAGQPALLTTLYSRSPFRGDAETDALVTVARPEGLFYMIFIAPQSEFEQIQTTFEQIIRTVRF